MPLTVLLVTASGSLCGMSTCASPGAARVQSASGIDVYSVDAETGWFAYPGHRSVGPTSACRASSWARPSSCSYRGDQTPRRWSPSLHMAPKTESEYGPAPCPGSGPAMPSSFHQARRVAVVVEPGRSVALLPFLQGKAASVLRLRGCGLKFHGVKGGKLLRGVLEKRASNIAGLVLMMDVPSEIISGRLPEALNQSTQPHSDPHSGPTPKAPTSNCQKTVSLNLPLHSPLALRYP